MVFGDVRKLPDDRISSDNREISRRAGVFSVTSRGLAACKDTSHTPCGAAGLPTHAPAAMHDYDYETIR